MQDLSLAAMKRDVLNRFGGWSRMSHLCSKRSRIDVQRREYRTNVTPYGQLPNVTTSAPNLEYSGLTDALGGASHFQRLLCCSDCFDHWNLDIMVKKFTTSRA